MLQSKLIILFGLSITFGLSTQIVFADEWNNDKDYEFSGVYIPENEFTSYFDSNGYYTVVGAIKNFEQTAIVPTVTITIQDGINTISESYEYDAIFPTKEMPFKIKFPQVITSNPILMKPQVSFSYDEQKNPLNIEMIYDDTLVLYDNGHTTGRIINNGDKTISNISVSALVYGENGKLLDMGQNINYIDEIKPNEIIEFTIYPDPKFESKVKFYSCFAIGASNIIPVSTLKNDERFDFRYISGATFIYPTFNDDGTELSMAGSNVFPLDLYANFEFPRATNDEKFQVFFNNQPRDFIQSIDEMGNWHVAFNVAPREIGDFTITGFDKTLAKLNEQPIEESLQNVQELTSNLGIELSVFNTPLKQLKNGISAEDIICKTDLQLIFKPNSGDPVCVKPSTAAKLELRGW